MKNYNKSFTLLICGQILSRVEPENYGELIAWLKESQRNFSEIVISTWENEVNSEINKHYMELRTEPGNVAWRSINWDLFAQFVDDMNEQAQQRYTELPNRWEQRQLIAEL